jgi:hypothetical protein
MLIAATATRLQTSQFAQKRPVPLGGGGGGIGYPPAGIPDSLGKER